MSETHVQQRSQIATELEFHAQCTAAISAHGEWKIKLKSALSNKGQGLDVTKVAQDDQCVFGKWLYSSATDIYRKDTHYEHVRELHAEFHKEAAAVVHLCQHDRISEAEAALGDKSSYVAISSKLVTAVRRWMRDRTIAAGRKAHELETNTQQKISWTPVYMSLIGVVAGLLFVFGALAITYAQYSLPLLASSLANAHSLNPVIYLVDTAPLILGTLAFFIGRFIALRNQEAGNLQVMVDKRTAQLLNEQAEMVRIFDNLDEGIFTLNAERQIGPKYSQALEDIFENTEISGRTLSDIFAGRITKGTQDELEGYLDLVFSLEHQEAMLRDLNPFNPLKLDAVDDSGHKIISTRFHRIINKDNKVEAVMCIAADITAEHDLKQKLAEQEKIAAGQMDMIQNILEIGPEMLSSFRVETQNQLNHLTDTLRRPSHEDYHETARNFFRIIHTIKGSAALLGLTRIAMSAHRYEEKLSQLQAQKVIEGMDFLPLTILHGNLITELEAFEMLLGKIRDFQVQTNSETSDKYSLIAALLKRLTKQLSAEQNKPIEISLITFSEENLSAAIAEEVRDILIQLIRNSAAHGIEDTETRSIAGKSQIGKIRVKAVRKHKNSLLSYEDDGLGFDLNKIRNRIASKNLATDTELETMSNDSVVKFIFKPGFSTAAATDMTAGRGMGMDIISEKIRKLGGKIRLRWSKGNYTQFIFKIPHSQSNT